MDLNFYKEQVQYFLDNLQEENWNISRKTSELKKEYEKLLSNINNRDVVSHHIYDILFILFEIACELDIDIENEWQKGTLRKQQKYLQHNPSPHSLNRFYPL